MNKKLFVGLLTASLLLSVVVPYSSTSAQTTCNVDALRRVSFGQRGPAVGALQRCLIELGYLNIARPTNYYGSQTAAAVLQFYRDANIQAGVQARGRVFGPAGIAAMRQMLAGEMPEREEVVRPQPEQQPQPQPQTGQVPSEVLNQALALILAGKTNEALALIAPYLGGQLPPVATPTQQTTTPPTTQPFELGVAEGNLTVEKNTTPPDQQVLREGETMDVLGIRLRATQGNVLVQRIRIDWPATGVDAPFRVLSRLSLVDERGNTLWSADVTSAEGQPFYRESNGQYYLLITGLNIGVQKDQTRVVTLRATAVSTYPSVGNVTLTVPMNGVRALTGSGVNLFGPGTAIQNTFVRQATLAGSAQLSVVRSSDSPQERNVVANEFVSGVATSATMRLTQDLPLLKVRMTAQNDSLRLREFVFTYTATGGLVPTNFYFEVGGRKVGTVNVTGATVTISNLYTDNVVINRDQTVEAVVGVSRVDSVGYTGGSLTVTLSSVSYENSLGGVNSPNVSGVSSYPVYIFAVAPTFAFSGNVSASRVNQNTNSTTLAFTGLITVSVPNNVHAGGQVRISSSSPFILQWEIAGGNTSSVAYTISSVRDANNVPVQQQGGGYYVLNAGDTYRFELSASGFVVNGLVQARVRVNSITWAPGNGGSFVSPITTTYVANTFETPMSSLPQ